MPWMTRQAGETVPTDTAMAKEYEQDKAKAAPLLERAVQTAKSFAPIQFQPVISPDIYEGEFAQKESDIIFHFWPYGYQKAINAGVKPPRFPSAFEAALLDIMVDVFGENRVKVARDHEMGAFFGQAVGWGESPFWRALAIQACTQLHLALGGTPG